MKVLFWVDPLIEFGRPMRKLPWLEPFSTELMGALREARAGRDYRFCVATNEALASRVEAADDVEAQSFSQQELFQPFGSTDALALSLAWYRRTLSARQLAGHAETIRERLGRFVPDVVVTYTPSPHVAAAFPEALVLHREYGPFSRKPFPETWYLDPCGMYEHSLLSRHVERLASLPAARRELQPLDEFREAARGLLRQSSPFVDLVERSRARFRHLLLLPLGYSGYYSIDGICSFKSQFEILLHVLDQVPREVGVLVTTHPDGSELSPDTVDYLRARYPHFLFDERLDEVYAPSQYLLPEVDGLVAVSSWLAFQALFWRKRLFPLGDYFRPFAGEGSLARADEVLNEEAPDREGFVRWLLTHYTIPRRYLYDPQWAAAFLDRALARHREGSPGPEFYDPVAPDSEIFASLCADLERTPHPGPRPSYDRLQARMQGLEANHRELLHDLAVVAEPATAIDAAVDGEVVRARHAARRGRVDEAVARVATLASRMERAYSTLARGLARIQSTMVDSAQSSADRIRAAAAAPSTYPELIAALRGQPHSPRLLEALERVVQRRGPDAAEGSTFRPAERYCILVAADLDAFHDAWPRWMLLFRRLFVPAYCLGDPCGARLTTVQEIGGPAVDDAEALEVIRGSELAFAQDPLSARLCAAAGVKCVILGDPQWVAEADASRNRVVRVPAGGIDLLGDAPVVEGVEALASGLVAGLGS